MPKDRDIFDDIAEEKRVRKQYDLSNRKAIIVDYGHFLSHAVRLAKDFGETFYVPLGWKGSFAKPERSMIGRGLPGLTCIPDFFEAKRKIDLKKDLIAFFDVGDGAMAEDLRNRGYARVFSMGTSELIEQNRYKFKALLESVDLPVIPYNGGDWKKGYIIGLTALEKRLQQIDGPKWIKLSTFRGLSETFKFESYLQVQPILIKMRHDAGTFAEYVEFLIEDDVPAEEGGNDNIFTKGQYFPRCLQGYEKKFNGYAAKVIETKNLPKSLLTIIEKINPYLKNNGAMGMLSIEARVTKDGTAYYTDATQRSGNPPGDLQTGMWVNFSEMVYAAAGGEVVTPIPADKYGIQLNIASDWVEHESMIVEFPDKFKDSIKLRNIAFLDGHYHFIPQSGGVSMGSTIGIASNLNDAFNHALEAAKSIKGIDVSYDEQLLQDLQKTIQEGEKRGLGKF